MLQDLDEEDPTEVEADKFDLIISNSMEMLGAWSIAGLAMATMDIIKLGGTVIISSMLVEQHLQKLSKTVLNYTRTMLMLY